MKCTYNFSAGPAMLPESVLLRAQQMLLNWEGTGSSIMEMGHRTPLFQDLLAKLEQKLRDLITIPQQYKILFLAGGAQGHFSFIPMNLTKYKHDVDYLVTGIWSERAAKFAARYANVNIVTTPSNSGISDKTTWQFNPNAAYAFYCQNETINGIQFNEIPDTGDVPLVVDMTSSILSEEMDVTKFGLIFASAQKNLGIAGITLLIVREDLLGQALDCVPEIFNYALQAEQHSLANTIPVFPVYMMDLMVDWILHEEGGLKAVVASNHHKVSQLYACIDNSNGFYRNPINPAYRSQVNIPFSLPNDELLKLFLSEAGQQGLKYLQGHRLVGGARASLYNAMPLDGVMKLIAFMDAFARKNG